MLTIVTPLLNSDPLIRETFNSFKNHISSELRWVIKNNDKSDNHTYINEIKSTPHITYINKSDTSLYDGMNQALNIVETPFYLVVGAGDTFALTSVSNIIERLQEAEELAAVFFGVNMLSSSKIFHPMPENLSSYMSTPHPGAILRTKYSKQIQGFDLKYKIAADYDHLSRYVQNFGRVGIVDTPIINYLGGGISDSKWFEAYLEEQLIRLRVWKKSVIQTQEVMHHQLSNFLNAKLN